MSANLEALVPGGTIVAAAVGLLSWFVRNSREDRAEWRAQLQTERDRHDRELADERGRHDRDMATAERTEAELRRRLEEDQKVITALRDELAEQMRALRARTG